MLRMISSILAIALMFTLSLATASATPSDCTLGTTDVLTLNPEGCELQSGDLLFNNFMVSDNNPSYVYEIGINGSYSGGPHNELRFTVAPAFGPADVILSYKVTSFGTGVDSMLGTYHGPVSVTEVVCRVEPVNGICPQNERENSLLVYPGEESAMFMFESPLMQYWVIKDVSIPRGASMSDFSNSHHTGEVPEPETFALMGAGLIGFAFLKRRRG